MILLTSIICAFIVFTAICVVMLRYQSKNGLRAQLMRRLNRLKTDDILEQIAKKKKKRLSLSDIPFVERTIIPMFKSLKKTLVKIAPTDIINLLEKQIVKAGKSGQWRIEGCIVAWFASVAACGFITFILLEKFSEFMFFQVVVLSMLGAGVGAVIPFLVFRDIIQKRQKLIVRQLPEFLDLLSVSVQAGLTFDNAMTRIVARMNGPLIDECKMVQRDGQMGIPRRLSLQNMAKRCDLEEVYLFTSSVIQSEKLGTSMMRTLSTQAENMRERHRQYVKAMALKAPVKIVFPLIIFIFPAIFVVVLLPSLMTMLRNLG